MAMALACAQSRQLLCRCIPMDLTVRCFPSRRPISTSRLPKLLRMSKMATRIRFGAQAKAAPCRFSAGSESSGDGGEDSRPAFDLNLAVVLAGFAFEAYTSPPDNVGWREMDAAECLTVFLSEDFLREVYDGQLFVKLKKGTDLPAMDPWGTSDPYVTLQLDGQCVKSKIKWATKEPVWNEDYTFNIKKSRAKFLKVEAWDANLVTPHKRMGNGGIDLELLSDGNLHEVAAELEGIGGGGTIHLELNYKSFDEIERYKQWWIMPFLSDLLARSNLGNILEMVLGSGSISASEFVKSAFGQLNTFTYSYLPKPSHTVRQSETCGDSIVELNNVDKPVKDLSNSEDSSNGVADTVDANANSNSSASVEGQVNLSLPPDEYFWNTFRSIVSENILRRFGFPLPDIKKFDGLNLLSSLGLQSQQVAEKQYLESGLATSTDSEDEDALQFSTGDKVASSQASFLDIKKLSWDVLGQTETIFGALLVLSSNSSQLKKDLFVEKENETFSSRNKPDVRLLESKTRDGEMKLATDKQKAEDMKQLFSSAESAMEAWAMLATSLGRNSFIKSDFQKICYLDNASTDTQVSIWRDCLRRRLVIAFRGTEQAKWKDLRTDLMLLPAGLNPERLGSDFKNEVQVHSGFLNAYDSVRNRIMTLVKHSIGFIDDDDPVTLTRWHVYVTGHSLGGALATLLALELSSSQMSLNDVISVSMYNFGSPRVGNRRFAEVYNAKVRDSWRVVNHRDIIPTVPRLMGYCHVAEPVYLAVGDIKEALASMEVSRDGYGGDVIGESTPDVLVSEFMKGEKQLIEKIIETEINLLRAIRDGSALMQHMEDFYYVTLLESVKTNYEVLDSSSQEDRQLTA